MDKEVAEQVRAAQKDAEAQGVLADGLLQHPYASMFEGVFEEMPWHLKEQAEQMHEERKAAGI
jgi:2-oxoisovalerate dehydrogenase E1 component alpha subunit